MHEWNILNISMERKHKKVRLEVGWLFSERLLQKFENMTEQNESDLCKNSYFKYRYHKFRLLLGIGIELSLILLTSLYFVEMCRLYYNVIVMLYLIFH